MSTTMTVTLRRPFTLTDYDENGPKDGSTLPVGTVLTLTVTDESLEADIAVDAPGAVGGIESAEQLLKAAAEVPCEHVMEQWCDCSDGTCSHGGWFGCRRFDDENAATCLGDKARCPFDWVQAEAKTIMAAQSQEESPHRGDESTHGR